MAKILQIGMIPHNMTLFKVMCVQYQFHGQTLPIMKIDRGQIQFREYVSTGTEPDLSSDLPRHFRLLLAAAEQNSTKFYRS